jgi:L-alanine-DL-glutamate epimerase-like enolase superfamily enzyme
VRHTRMVVGDAVEVFVDANGGYTVGQARRVGGALDDLGVTWFEEPVSSDDLAGLALLRRHLALDVTAGEYAYDLTYAQRMCAAGAVDCLQLDVTRIAGITEWRRAAAVAAGLGLEVSTHCAPALHVAVAASVPNLRHMEYFVDHARLEPLLFDGVPSVVEGRLAPVGDRPGAGLTLRPEADRFRVG